ncbi:MAG: hypothetical protein HY897_16270 [Deltaproteobacteria bacterium]|nr:hypothetical protein [Deltaproteobacteria bacterium]
MSRRALSALCLAIALVLFPLNARAEEPAATCPDLPGRLGPFELTSADGKSSIELGIAAQLLLKFESKDSGPGNDRQNTGGLEIRRLRETLSGTFLDRNLSYYMHLSTAPGSLEMMDVYLNYAASPDIQIRAGQLKIPFTRYRIGSYKNLTFADWAIVTKYFGAERQRGFAIHNGFERPPKVEYELGLMMGQNVRASHGIGIATIFGETPPNPSDLVDPAPAELPHLEPVLHIAYNHGGIDTSTDTDWEGGPIRFSAGLGLAWDTRPTDYLDQYVRLAPEFLLKVRGFSLFGIYYLSTREKNQSMVDTSIAMVGGLVQASYLLHRRVEISGRYAFVSIDDETANDARDRAGFIILQESDEEKKAALEKQHKNAGAFEREQELTFGVNVYITGRSLKWQNDVSLLMHDTTNDERLGDWRFRSQIGLAF